MIRLCLGPLALCLFVVQSCLAADAHLTFADFYGTWKIDRMVGVTEITGDEASSRKGLGTVITMSADRVSNSYTPTVFCKPENPTITRIDTEAKLENDYGTKGSGLYLPPGTLKPQMPYLELGCESAFILDRNTLLWTLANGFIYTARREQHHARP